MPPASPVTALAHIDELVVMIFAHLEPKHLVTAACVSKHWSDLALDCLWFEVRDLKKVITVLAPLVIRKRQPTNTGDKFNGAYVFKRSLSKADWKRFQRYSGRVRRLRHDQRSMASVFPRSSIPRSHIPLHNQVYEDLAATCPTQDIFPNLQSIEWLPYSAERQRLVLTFMHGRVRHLGLYLYRSDQVALAEHLGRVATACPNVTSLDLSFEQPIREYGDDVLVLLQGLPHLHRLSVPIYCLSSRMFVHLSRHHRLEQVSLSNPDSTKTGDRVDIAQFSPVVPEGSFSALRCLSFSTQVVHATQLLRRSNFPLQLSELHLKTILIASPPALTDLFAAVHDRCPALVDFSVDYILGPSTPVAWPPPPSTQRPSLTTFAPLFAARSLRVFRFRWDYALNVSDKDMETFARGWTFLESLELHPEPVPEPEPDAPRPSLRAVIPFARHCTNLRHLSLNIDARVVPASAPLPPSVLLSRSSRSSLRGTPTRSPLSPGSPEDPNPMDTSPTPSTPSDSGSDPGSTSGPAPLPTNGNDDDADADSIPRFARLESLAVGLSAISKATPVALFLSQLLPPGCALRSGLRWPDAFDVALEHARVPGDVRAAQAAGWAAWADAAKLLPVATAARLEEQARADALARRLREMQVARREERRRMSWLERQVEGLRERRGATP